MYLIDGLLYKIINIHGDIYMRMNMRDQVMMTNDYLFTAGLPCNISELIFPITSKNDGINHNFLLFWYLLDNRIINTVRSK